MNIRKPDEMRREESSHREEYNTKISELFLGKMHKLSILFAFINSVKLQDKRPTRNNPYIEEDIC